MDARDSRRFKHVFLDAEGTLYIPHRGRSTWEFWADPSPEHAKDFFVLDEGVAEALRSLRDRVDSLCIVSRNSKPILDALLDDFGIRDYFDEVILNGNKGKQIVKYMAERGYDRRDAVMVRPYNRQADAERIKGVRELPSWLKIADIAERDEGPRNSTLDDFLDAPPERTGRLISATGC